MTETDASPRVRPTLPRGFADRDGADIAAAEAMMAKIREVYALYGFEAVETPFVEYTDALGKFLPDQDRPNEGVFSFKDDDEQWLSLRYDLTAPLARHVAENYDRLPKPYRSYRSGWVFRNEKPGPGRFRQFMQFDADTVGAASPAADAEICMMAADCLEALGVKRGDYVIKVNSRKLLDGILDSIRVGEEEDTKRRLVVLRALDKYDRLGIEGVELLLGPGRRDASGDFTRGAELDEDQTRRVLEIFQAQLQTRSNYPGADDAAKDDAAFAYSELDRARGGIVQTIMSLPTPGAVPVSNGATIAHLRSWFGGNAKCAEALDDLDTIARLVDAGGYGTRRIRIDPSVVRGLEYYTGPVFEAELTFKTKDEEGREIRFGSVGGGGRYDGLVSRFRQEPVPATGFSIGVSRLLAALRAIKSPIVAAAETQGPVVVLALDTDPASMANYQRLVARLRNADPPIAAELYLGDGKMNAQLKYADRRRSRVAVIQGGNERGDGSNPQVTIRDLKLGAELAKTTKDRADYLELRQRAQFSAPEAELVERVSEVLGRP
jgi:histidyl-tRNA synthetase